MAFAEDVYERSRRTRDGKVRHVPFHQHFAIFLLPTTLFFLTMLNVLYSPPVNPLLSTSLLHCCVSISSLPIHRTPFTLHITICHMDLTINRFSLCTVLSMLFAWYALPQTTHGHSFVFTIEVSRLNEHNEKPAFLPVP